MARSQYVYVVQEHESRRVLATFTVKHELMAWLTRRANDPGGVGLRDDEVWRFPDGGGRDGVRQEVDPMGD